MEAGGAEDISADEIYESKMKDAMDLATEKSAATRIKGIDLLCTGLLKRFVKLDFEGLFICNRRRYDKILPIIFSLFV